MIVIKLLFVSLLLIRGMFTDRQEGKIENELIIMGGLIGMLCAGIEGGISELILCGKMFVIVILALFIVFLLKGLGAGDIKLLAMLGIFFPKQIVAIIITSFFVAGAYAVIRMLVRSIRGDKVYRKSEAGNGNRCYPYTETRNI